MNPDIYIVGEVFPDTRYRGAKDAAVVSFMETTFNVIIFLDKPTPVERKAFSTESFEYGLFKNAEVPFITLDFKVMNFATSFNSLAFPPDELSKWVTSTDNAMALFLVEANTYRLENMRVVGLSNEFMKDLRDTLSRQVNTYHDPGEVVLKVRSLENRYTVKSMIDQSRKFRI